MNQAAVLSQHSQQQQQHPHNVANGRENRGGHGGGNSCNNNNIQSGPIISSLNTLNKDIDGNQSTMLGHKIWDKSMRFDTYDDVKLEYMDLEEFLIENELPIDSVFDEQQSVHNREEEENRRRSAVQTQQSTQQTLLQEDQFHKRNSIDTEANQPALQSSDHLVTSTDHQIHPHQTSNEQQHNTTSGSHSQQLQQQQQQPQQQHQQQQLHQHQPASHHSSNLMVSNVQQTPAPTREPIDSSPAPRSNVNPSLHSQSLISSSSLNVLSSGSCVRGATNNSTSASNEHLPQIPIKAESQDAVSRMHLENSSSSFNSRLESGLYEDTGEEKISRSLSASRTACSPDVMSPGEQKLEDDIRRYSFGDDDIKPPRELMIESPTSPSGNRKRSLSPSGDSKDDRYWERRRKNNMAAKRSRDARRVKENQIAMKATFYERENKILTQELGKARAEIHLLRERLCKYEIV